MPVEVLEMLNGAIPATAAIRCACGTWMPQNGYGQPCPSCLEDIHEQDRADVALEANDLELLEDWIDTDGEFWPESVCRAWERSGQKMSRWSVVD